MNKVSGKQVSRYYTVDLPSDLAEEMTEEALVDLAIAEVRERQKVYRLPVEWRGVWVRGGTVRLRYSYRQA